MDGGAALPDEGDDVNDGDRSKVATSLGRLGVALLAAGYPVTDAAELLRRTATIQGWRGVTVGMLPSAVLVDDARIGITRVVNAGASSLTFTQSAMVADLAKDAASTSIPAPELTHRLRTILDRPNRYPPLLAATGSGLMSGGIAVVFQTTWWAVLLAAVVGLMIGAVLVVQSGRLARLAVTPFVAAFLVALLIYALAPVLQWGPATLYVVCAPLVIFIPGATITTAVLEISAGDMISGGGRLVSGLMTWLILAVGIAAGAAVTGQPITGGATRPNETPSALLIPLALIVMAIGVGLFFDAAPPLIAVISVVLLATYAVIAGCSLVLPGAPGSGVAAALILPACRLVERIRTRWPQAVTFRPAFWLLVPGSLGLVTLSSLPDTTDAGDTATLVASTVVAITIGMQIGGIVSNALPRLPWKTTPDTRPAATISGTTDT